ncbi:hypothetical protein OF846_002722 [Rhodotorula toruloides]|nr:hypothetical protein OF846_002722 [Rhodotorula toruloides]
MVFRRFSTNSAPNKGQQPASAAPSSASNSARSPSTRNSLPSSNTSSARRTSLAGSMSGLSLAGSTGGASTATAPPPYQAVSMSAGSAGRRAVPARRSSIEDKLAPLGKYDLVILVDDIEDKLAPLGKYDLVILVDDSPSMIDYWDETRTALMGVVEACGKYDRDGIDLYFMNNEDRKLENVIDTKVVARAFREIEPFGSTPTGVVMDEILRDYVERVEDARQTKERVKPLLLLVLTDGRADDTDLVRGTPSSSRWEAGRALTLRTADVIVEMAQRLDEVRAPPYQLGIQFIQIGDDPDARAFLQELDDDLKPQLGVRDMVDTTPYGGQITPEFLLKAALGAVVKSIDG